MNAGDALFNEGDEIDSIHLILHGCVSRSELQPTGLDQEGNQQLARDTLQSSTSRLGQGFLSHKVALDPARRHHYQLIALEASTVLKIDPSAFCSLLSDDNDLRESMLICYLFWTNGNYLIYFLN